MTKAKQLFTDFTGHKATKRRRFVVKPMPEELVEVGIITGLAYRTVRNGQVCDYFHEFKLKNAPILAVSPDGKDFYPLGGKYKFGELGFIG